MPSTVDHPPHYAVAVPLTRPILSLLVSESLLDGECIDAIERLDLGFAAGNVIKYLWRAGEKGDVLEDLEKALWYLRRCQTQGRLRRFWKGLLRKLQGLPPELTNEDEATAELERLIAEVQQKTRN